MKPNSLHIIKRVVTLFKNIEPKVNCYSDLKKISLYWWDLFCYLSITFIRSIISQYSKRRMSQDLYIMYFFFSPNSDANFDSLNQKHILTCYTKLL